LWVIFALLDPDPDSEYGSGSGSTCPIEYGSNPDPDPKPCEGYLNINERTKAIIAAGLLLVDLDS
jgi:hypothetical protein